MKVPALELPDVSPNVRPTPFQPAPGPDSFGAQVGDALQRTGAVGMQFATRERERQDAFRVADAQLELQKNIETRLHDPKTGFLVARGKDAMDTAPVRQGVNDDYQKTLDGLSSDLQKRIFQQRAGPIVEAANRIAEDHSAQQIRAVHESNAAAQETLALESIARDNSQANVAMHVNAARGPLALYWGHDQGYTNDGVKAKINEFERKAYSKALDGYLNRPYNPDGTGGPNVAGAMDYIASDTGGGATVRDKLGTALEDYQKKINEALKGSSVGVQAEKALAGVKTLQGGLMDEVDANNRIRAVPFGPLHEAIQKEANQIVADHNRAVLHNEEQTMGGLGKIIEANGGHIEKVMGTTDYDSLTKAGQDKLWTRAEAIKKRIRTDYNAEQTSDLHKRTLARQQQKDEYEAASAKLRLMDPQEAKDADLSAAFPDVDPQKWMPQLQLDQKKIKDLYDKGQGETLGRLKDEAKARAAEMHYSPDRAKRLESDMTLWFINHHDDNSGRGPTDKETKAAFSEKMGMEKSTIGGVEIPFTAKPKFEREPEISKTAPAAAPKPTRKLSGGVWYIRGPNGEAVKDPNQAAQ